MKMIIECNVWCNGASDKEIELGLEAGDSWMPFAIDFNQIDSIKLAGPTEFYGDDKATIYYNGNHVTLDITFEQAIKLWKECQ